MRKTNIDNYRRIGKSIGIDWDNVSFTVAQFKKGLHTEMKEHHDDQETKVVTTAEEAGKIAWAHLKEDDKYYDKLAKMEESAGLKAILLKIESKIVTIDDFNELIQEATPESMRDRLRRRINVNQDTVRSHQDEDGHAKMSLPVMADRVQPKRKRADRTQMQHGGKMGHRHSARTQKRTMSKSLREAIEFFKGNIGRPIDQSLSTDISHTVLRNVATKLMGKPGINRDWLYNFCSSLSESVDDSGYNLQVVGEDCEPRNQADVICAEHSVQTAWAGEKQFAWESATQKHDDQEFSHDVSKWIEITGWTRRELYNWLGY